MVYHDKNTCEECGIKRQYQTPDTGMCAGLDGIPCCNCWGETHPRCWIATGGACDQCKSPQRVQECRRRRARKAKQREQQREQQAQQQREQERLMRGCDVIVCAVVTALVWDTNCFTILAMLIALSGALFAPITHPILLSNPKQHVGRIAYFFISIFCGFRDFLAFVVRKWNERERQARERRAQEERARQERETHRREREEREQREREVRERQERERQQQYISYEQERRTRQERERQQREQEERQQRARDESTRQERERQQQREQQERERRARQAEQNERDERERRETEQRAREHREPEISEQLFEDGPPREVPTELVMRWTNNFGDERKIGEGAFGDVFEGILADSLNQRQARVAVKRLKPEIRLQGDENEQRAAVSSIRREIHVLSTFHHPHIIRLLGYTSTSAGVVQDLCLVYELGYASLDKMLTDDKKATDLSCKVRVRIAAGVSRALNYLHCHDPRASAFHRDVKSANIVLDLALSPKLIDCGLSKFVPDQNSHGTIMSTRGASLGTPGYMCPTYLRTKKFDAKSEIYSLGMVLVELLLGRVQGVDDDDLFGIYIEEETPISNDLDVRAGLWIPTCAEQLEMLTRECLAAYKRRITTMMAVMRRLIELEKEFCCATAEEMRLTRLAGEMQRELEALRFEATTQSEAREKEQQVCRICFDSVPVSGGLGCERTAEHFICVDCAPHEVQRILLEVQGEEGPLARHRAQGGRIKCVQTDCDAMYAEPALARILPDELFREYRAAQDAVVEQRLFVQLQQRFQEQLVAARQEFENSSSAAKAEQDAAATAEFMRRQYPNAVQCPRCHAGPVIPENCYDLQAHHGETLGRGRGRISNACPSCGFFSRERGEWVRWDGQMR